jgi:oligopeptide transport system ATP-binding protein
MLTHSRKAVPLMVVRGLSHHYQTASQLSGARGAVKALDSVNLVACAGSTLAVVGESGAGKSTLARCMALLERPIAGEILLDGRNLLALEKQALLRVRRAIQLVFQDPTSSLNPRLTAAEIIAEPLFIQREGTRTEQYQRALQLMGQVGLPAKYQSKRPLEFSGGQRQRIFDEALSGLDLENQELILQLLTRLQDEHFLTFIHISHDLNLISRIADEIAVMYEGGIVEQKPAAMLLESQDHPYARELFSARKSAESILAMRFAGAL